MKNDLRDELLLALHSAATGKPAWEIFLKKCCGSLALSYASLIFRRGPGRQVDAEFFAGQSVTEELKQRYRQEFQSLDPVLYFVMEPGRSYRLPELMRTNATTSHPYYREFLEPARVSYMLSARIVEPDGQMAWLTLCRGRDQPDFGKDEQQMFDSLLPHMAVGLSNFLLIERHRVQAAIGRHVSARLETAAIALTVGGKVLGMGPLAHAIVEASSLVTLHSDGRLEVRDRVAHAQLAEAIRGVARTRQSKALLLARGDQRLEILVAPFEQNAGQGVVRPDIILYMRQGGSARLSAQTRHCLAEMFGLTPTEADIAVGLAAGRTMADLAGDLQLTENTIRSYTKTIYAKLGVRRQVDLVRLVLISVTQLG